MVQNKEMEEQEKEKEREKEIENEKNENEKKTNIVSNKIQKKATNTNTKKKILPLHVEYDAHQLLTH